MIRILISGDLVYTQLETESHPKVSLDWSLWVVRFCEDFTILYEPYYIRFVKGQVTK